MKNTANQGPGITGSDIFDIAIQIEQMGIDFYSEAAINARNEKVKTFLDRLAVMESRHLGRFRELKSCFESHASGALQDESDDILAHYLHSWLDGSVFQSGENLEAYFRDNPSLEETLWKAIAMEKNSIAFYHGLKGISRTEEDRRVVDRILSEELLHVVALGKLIKLVRKDDREILLDDLLKNLDELPTCES